MPVEIKNLTYIYSPGTPYEKKALDGISLTINDGDFFGIVGETGSGKSTLVSHINALTKIQKKYNEKASLMVDGTDLCGRRPDYKKLRETVGMVFQYPEYQLFADTVLEDIMFGPKNLGWDEESCRRAAYESLELVGMDKSCALSSPFELSGGQKRRIAIAGVIAMKPKILVLDEPTAGLDPKGKADILSLVKQLKKNMSIIIMVSHNMDEVAACCNKVGVLSGGILRGVYTPAELFSQKDILDSMCLDLPAVTGCGLEIKKAGLNIRDNILSEDELFKEIMGAIGK